MKLLRRGAARTPSVAMTTAPVRITNQGLKALKKRDTFNERAAKASIENRWFKLGFRHAPYELTPPKPLARVKLQLRIKRGGHPRSTKNVWQWERIVKCAKCKKPIRSTAVSANGVLRHVQCSPTKEEAHDRAARKLRSTRRNFVLYRS